MFYNRNVIYKFLSIANQYFLMIRNLTVKKKNY